MKEIAKKHKCDLQTLEKQLEKGQKIEMEHTKNKELAKKIAMDHIYEVPDYYDRLEMIETNL